MSATYRGTAKSRETTGNPLAKLTTDERHTLFQMRLSKDVGSACERWLTGRGLKMEPFGIKREEPAADGIANVLNDSTLPSLDPTSHAGPPMEGVSLEIYQASGVKALGRNERSDEKKLGQKTNNLKS